MQVDIKIDKEVKNNQRIIFHTDQPVHQADENVLQSILRDTKTGFWRIDENAGRDIGKRLYTLLNGASGCLTDAIKVAFESGEELILNLDLPKELTSLPFELLYSDRFLIRDPDKSVIRRIIKQNVPRLLRPQKRILNMLFIACSPICLEPVLSFELEEDQILKATEKYSIEIRFEDSGSVDGISNSLSEFAKTSEDIDILHITGHAGFNSEGPIFIMEDEDGMKDEVSPNRLWEALKKLPPRLLFLSGCSTGKSEDAEAQSFAEQMVKKGIPIVIGWGLPVSDRNAIIMTEEFFKHLTLGHSVTRSVQEARRAIEGIYHTWHLLRIFTDSSSLDALILPGEAVQNRMTKRVVYTMLRDSSIQVLEQGFVGRRRQIQQGIRVLKGASPQFGLLIHGPAGVGKSCLAGKFIERFKERRLIVIHGEIDTEKIVLKLLREFDAIGETKALEILRTNVEFSVRIKKLFQTVFGEHHFLFYFDDFEQNLEQRGEKHVLKLKTLEILTPLFEALPSARGKTQLLITSRYPFEMELNGSDMVKGMLFDLPLSSLRGADERKKINNLQYISQSSNKALFIRFGKGNPRILDWLNIIAKDEKKYNLEDLKRALEGKNEEYIRNYLANVMAGAHGYEFNEFLCKAAVYRIPVDEGAFLSFGTKKILKQGVDLTLMECEQSGRFAPKYWVAPIIRQWMWERLDLSARYEMHKFAFSWYDSILQNEKQPPHDMLKEIVYHALESDNIPAACKYVIDLNMLLTNALLYMEARNYLQNVADKCTKEIIERAIERKDANFAIIFNELGEKLRILGDACNAIEYYEKGLSIDLKILKNPNPNLGTWYNNLGSAWYTLGNVEKAIEYYGKAIVVDLKILGDWHPNVASEYNNLGEALCTLGDISQAIEYFHKSLLTFRNIFGEEHSNVAMVYNNLGWAWSELGDAEKAKENYEKAIVIICTIFGENHPDLATAYNNLGTVCNDLGKVDEAFEYYKKALVIINAFYGEEHPNISAIYNSIGMAWYSLGNPEKAIEYHEKALAINLKIFGEQHPGTTICYNNLGTSLQALGDIKKAIAYYEKALEIDLKNFDVQKPNIARDYNNLGVAWQALGNVEKAIEYFNEALTIFQNVHGDEHPSVSTSFYNLGKAWSASGNLDKAKDHYEKALAIDLKVYGEQHLDVARDYNNLSLAWRSMGRADKAIEYYMKTLAIDLKIFGPQHSDIARDYNNLGTAWQELGDAKKAKEYFEKALAIELRVFGNQHQYVAARYNSLGHAWRDLGDIEKAKECYNKAIAILISIYGTDHPSTKTVRDNLESLFKKIGK